MPKSAEQKRRELRTNVKAITEMVIESIRDYIKDVKESLEYVKYEETLLATDNVYKLNVELRENLTKAYAEGITKLAQSGDFNFGDLHNPFERKCQIYFKKARSKAFPELEKLEYINRWEIADKVERALNLESGEQVEKTRAAIAETIFNKLV